MSIYPRIINKNKIEPVTLHMRIENNNKKDILGKMVFIITDPLKNKKKMEKIVVIKSMNIIEKYFIYKINNNSPIGRYLVDGRFYVGKKNIRSENYKTDFFEVI